MATAAASALRRWGQEHAYPLLFGVLSLVVGIPFLFRSDAEWDRVYLQAARDLRAGVGPYAHDFGYLYPPFQAWAAIPFTYLPLRLGLAAWLAVNLACLSLLLRWAWRLAGGGRLQPLTAAPWQDHVAAVVGTCCGLFYLMNCLAHRQTDVVNAALLLGGCTLLFRGAALRAAVCFGLAAAMKCTPLLWMPYLIWRGRVAAGLLVLVVALGVNSLPDLTHPGPPGQSWFQGYIQSQINWARLPTHPGYWASDPLYNQSLTGIVARSVLTELRWSANKLQTVPRDPWLSAPATRWVIYVLEAPLLLLVLVVARRPWRPIEQLPDASRRAPLEYAIVLCLMLLLSPMSSRAHFGTLALPGMLIARAALARRDGLLGALLGLSFLAALTCNQDLIGDTLHAVALWCGTTTWQTLFLLIGCLVLLHRTNRDANALRAGQQPSKEASSSSRAA
jgi:hypothetical protein